MTVSCDSSMLSARCERILGHVRKRTATHWTREFASAWLRAQAPSVRALTIEWADRLAAKTRDARVDILPAAQRLLFDCFAVGVVGAKLSPNDYDNFTVLANYGSARMLQMGTLAAELPPDGVEARERWLAMFMRRIAEERARPRPEARDLLAVTVREGDPFFPVMNSAFEWPPRVQSGAKPPRASQFFRFALCSRASSLSPSRTAAQ